MAAGKLTVDAVRKALYLQSHGGAIGRYYVQRTVDHLRQCHDYFREDVKEIRASVPSDANHAFQRFVFENVPQLKYRNPQTMFNFNLRDERPPELVIFYADGQQTEINIDRKQSEIYNDVIEATRNMNDDLNIEN